MSLSISESFDYEFKGGKHLPTLSTVEREEMEASIPQTYNPCPCASGKNCVFCKPEQCASDRFDKLSGKCMFERQLKAAASSSLKGIGVGFA